MNLTIDDLPRRKRKEFVERHIGLRSRQVKVGIWPFRRREIEVLCSCGWVHPDNIPVLPVEMAVTTSYLVDVAFTHHISKEVRLVLSGKR